MKLSIRYADKIVGVLIIAALGILVFVIIMLGSSQRWFSRDYTFKTYFPTAVGLSQNMAVQYKGFTIGHVKSIRLGDDDQVEVTFTVFDTYRDRVKTGSLVDVPSSPLGSLLGSQFLFYPGLGNNLVEEGDVVPTVNSSEGKRLISLGLAGLPETEDSISNIMAQVETLLGTVNTVLADVQNALKGNDETALGKTILGVQSTIETLPADITDTIDRIVAQIEPVLANIRELTDKLADPDGTVMAILDSDGDIYIELVKSLNALSGILKNLEKSTDFLPANIAGLLADVDAALIRVNDVLVSLTNNPLLKGGVPDRKETNVGSSQTRDIEF